MGASRWRLMRLVLVESALLSLVGGAVGLLIAIWSLDAIHALSPPGSLRFQETEIDTLTLSFTTVTGLLCGILVGAWPTWRVSRLASLSGVLHETGTRGGSDSTSRQRARRALVVVQKFFPNVNPLGLHLLIDQDGGGLSVEVIGVVGSSRHDSLAVAPKPEYYRPITQNPNRSSHLLFRTSLANASGLQAALRRISREWIATSLCRNWRRWRT